LLVYFSGHGDEQELPGGEKVAYLIPVDGEKSFLSSTCLPDRDIRAYSKMFKAVQVLFIVDSCYSGSIGEVNKGRKVTRMTKERIGNILERRTRQALTASSPGETATMGKRWDDHSVFTYYLLKGFNKRITGERNADLDENGVIFAEELQIYLSNKVSNDTNNKQNPQLYNVGGDQEGSFIFYREGDI
jgi:uncharacterized caspase-like protein